MIIDSKGDTIYVSETVSLYLGLSQVELKLKVKDEKLKFQVEMTGNRFIDYVHRDDVESFQSVIRQLPPN